MLKLNKKVNIYLSFVFLTLLSLFSPLLAEKRNVIIGFHTGYSFYTPRDYNESSTLWSKSVWGNRLGLVLGVNLQVKISSNGFLEAEISHQKRTFFDEHFDYQHPEFNGKWERDDSYLVMYINFLYKILSFQKEKISLYSIAGVGMYRYCPLSLKMGIGGKYLFLSKTHFDISVSYSSSLLVYSAEGGGIDFYPLALRYISLNLGLEREL